MSAIQILTAKLQRDLSEMEGYWAKAEVEAGHAEVCTIGGEVEAEIELKEMEAVEVEDAGL